MGPQRQVTVATFFADVESIAPEELTTGQHHLVVIRGTAYHLRWRVRDVVATIGGHRFSAAQHGGPSPELELLSAGTPRMSPQARRAGFSVFCVVPPLRPGTHAVVLSVELESGEIRTVEAGEIAVREKENAPALGPGIPVPRIAVCMATHEPDERFFTRQVESIKAQSLTDWHCFVSDDGSGAQARELLHRVLDGDERFTLTLHDERVGFYRNFERALRSVPAAVELVALADQDDLWYPGKLERAAGAFADPGVTLACSDARIVDEQGAELAPSFYETRSNTADDPMSLFLVNSVIGASMMFSADLLPAVLPFPARDVQPYHDHWIARVATAAGSAVFIETPLYDYVQHGANVLGFGRARPHWRGELAHPWARLANGMSERDREDWAPFHAALALDRAEAELALRRVGDTGRPTTRAAQRALRSLDQLSGARVGALGRVSAMWLYDQFGRRRPHHESIEMLHLRGMVWKRLQMN